MFRNTLCDKFFIYIKYTDQLDGAFIVWFSILKKSTKFIVDLFYILTFETYLKL